ncbi:MAG: pilus assembly FimT family protein [Gemmatirosa sp.]
MSVPSPRRRGPDARAARRARRRPGFSMVELLLTIAVAGLMLVIAAPRARAFREASSVRGARQELATAIEAARGAAIQRSRPARVRIRTDGVLVTVDTGALGAAATGRFTVLGPLRLDTAFSVTVTPAVPGDTIVAYDSRGLASPRLGHVARYVIARGVHRDSVCVSNLGMILPRGCAP